VPVLPVLELGGRGECLRALERGDADRLFELMNDPDVLAWVDPAGCTGAQAIARITASMPGLDDRGGELAISGADELMLGTISLSFYGPTRGSIGFELLPDARGRGTATYAVEALTQWAYDTYPELVRRSCGSWSGTNRRSGLPSEPDLSARESFPRAIRWETSSATLSSTRGCVPTRARSRH